MLKTLFFFFRLIFSRFFCNFSFSVVLLKLAEIMFAAFVGNFADFEFEMYV